MDIVVARGNSAVVVVGLGGVDMGGEDGEIIVGDVG